MIADAGQAPCKADALVTSRTVTILVTADEIPPSVWRTLCDREPGRKGHRAALAVTFAVTRKTTSEKIM